MSTGVLTRVRLHSGEGGDGTGWIVLTVLGLLLVGFIVYMVIKAHRTNKREGFPNQPKPGFPPQPPMPPQAWQQPPPPPQWQQPYPPQPPPPGQQQWQPPYPPPPGPPPPRR